MVELHRSLLRHNFSVAALHGDMDQPSRMRALDGFRQGATKFLVASDVAARGLDIPAVSHIFNFDVPHHSEDYVHRIGRTGRAGLEGTAITLVAPSDAKSLDAIEKLIGQPIPWSGAPVQPSRRPWTPSRAPAKPRKARPERSRSKTGLRAARATTGCRANEGAETGGASAAGARTRNRPPSRRPTQGRLMPSLGAPPTTPEPAVLGLGDHVPSFLLAPRQDRRLIAHSRGRRERGRNPSPP